MTHQTVALLLDSAPINWTSQEDRHLKLCEMLVAKNITPVLVFSENIQEEFQARLRDSGANIEAITYGRGALHYSQELRRLVKRYDIITAHIIFLITSAPCLGLSESTASVILFMRCRIAASSKLNHLLRAPPYRPNVGSTGKRPSTRGSGGKLFIALYNDAGS